MKTKILEIFNDITQKISKDNTNRYFKNHFPNEYNQLLDLTKELEKFNSETNKNKKISIFERIYFIKNNLSDRPKCKCCQTNYVCGFNKQLNEYKKWCSPKCQSSDKDCLNKVKQTKQLKYGNENYSGCEKARQTRLLKNNGKWHSDEFSAKLKEINKNKTLLDKQKLVEKVKKTKLERYGIANFNNKDKNKITRKTNFYNKFLLLNEYIYPMFSLDEYINSNKNTILLWKCKKCNSIFKSKFNYNFKQDNFEHYVRCLTCFPHQEYKVSYKEKDINEFIQLLNINTISNSRSIISPLELDIYIPEKKLAIEFDGLYWHSELNKEKDYHLNKTELCEKQGIQLIHIFEDEWENKQEIVKSRLKNLLGIYDKTIYARNCEVKIVDKNISKQFQNENHIQGNVRSLINIGLYYNNELISLMTFGKSRFNKKYKYELLRFCNKLGYHIPGSASKLLKYFERNYKPKSLISYADRRWSRGNVYEKLGFKMIGKSKPNYWYLSPINLSRESRIQYQKHKLKNILEKFDETLSESENMKLNGYNRIYDCGNLVYIKTMN
jgi:hypothetical protein